MNIAELFVKIGLQGTEAAAKGLNAIKGSLGDVASESLAAKAAIAGVIIGLERLTGFASQVGMDLYKFGVTTGLSTDELQKWQYAAMRFDVSGEEMANTIKTIQNAMTNMKLGKGAPEGFATMMDMVQLDPNRVNDTFYVLNKIQEFTKKAPANFANTLVKSMGISDNVFQMLKSSNIELDKIQKKDIITQKEIDRLVEINKAWKDFWFSLKTFGIKFVAAEGLGAVKELAEAFKFITTLGSNIQSLAQAFPMLKTVAIATGVAIALAFAPLTATVAGLLVLMAEVNKYKSGKESFLFPSQDKVAKAKADYEKMGFLEKLFGKTASDFITRPLFPGAGGGSQQTTNTFHVDGSKDPKETAMVIQKHIEGAARKLSAQTGSH